MKELIKIQHQLKAPKGQMNKFGGYKYRSCEDILEALKPLLAENNCYVTINDTIELIGDRVYVKAVATIANGKESVSAQAYAREAQSKKGMDEAQVTGSASSYARKYALNGLFAIDDTKDSDATNTHGSRQQLTELTGAQVNWIKQQYYQEGRGITDIVAQLESKYTIPNPIKKTIADICESTEEK